MDSSIIDQLAIVADKLGWMMSLIYADDGEIIGVILGVDEYVEYLFDNSDHDDVH